MRSAGGVRLSKSANPFALGSWEPGRFHLSDALVIKLTLLMMALARGFDYFTPRVTTPGPVTEVMQTAFPLHLWGVIILVPAVLLAVGLAGRIHFAVWVGHGLLSVVYASLFVSLMLVYVERPMLDGVRSATVLLAPLVVHALLCGRTGWRPPRWDQDDTAVREG